MNHDLNHKSNRERLVSPFDNLKHSKSTLSKAFTALSKLSFASQILDNNQPILTKQFAEQLSKSEKIFSANNFMGHETNPVSMYLDGQIPIMISAPHAVSQWRNGKIKPSEAYTGPLAIALNKSLNCPAFIKSKFDGTDPNSSSGIEYRQNLLSKVLEKKIEFMIDIHCMNPSRPDEIIIGTNNLQNLKNNKSFISIFKTIMSKHGFDNVLVDKEFTASSQYNVSRFISTKANIPCLQIEINSRIINAETNPERLYKMFLALSEFLKTVEKAVSIK